MLHQPGFPLGLAERGLAQRAFRGPSCHPRRKPVANDVTVIWLRLEGLERITCKPQVDLCQYRQNGRHSLRTNWRDRGVSVDLSRKPNSSLAPRSARSPGCVCCARRLQSGEGERGPGPHQARTVRCLAVLGIHVFAKRCRADDVPARWPKPLPPMRASHVTNDRDRAAELQEKRRYSE